MLVLTRTPGQLVILTLDDGRTIGVEVLDARPGKIRLGFTAPANVRIDRAEVYEARRAAAPNQGETG